MKLPDQPKERIKVLILILFSGIAIVSGSVQGLMFLQGKKRMLAEKLEELEWKSKSAGRDVLSAEQCKPRNIETLREIMSISHKHVLQPILGNYRLGASEILDPVAQRLGIEFQSVQEVGILDLPHPPARKTPNVFKVYSVRVSMECGYHKLRDFVRTLETDNPYLSVASIYIAGQEEKSEEKHRVVVGIQWPVWANYDMAAQFDNRVSETPLTGGLKP